MMLIESIKGALWLSGKLILIIVPLVMAFELLRHLAVFRRLGRLMDPLMGGLGLNRYSALPLFTGVVLGIAYGAGIIIRSAKEQNLTRRDLFLVGLFLATCHAVIEDTLIFVVIGGDAWLMLGVRLVLAVLLTAVLARLWKASAPTGEGEAGRS